MRVSSPKVLIAGLLVLGLSACQSAPVASVATVVPAPSPVPVAASAPAPRLTSVLARNFGAYDAGVFAVVDGGKAVWLTNVPAGGTRVIPIAARHLQSTGLVLRVHAIGSGRSWTSGATLIDGQATGVLDLAADRAGNPVGTLLRFVPTSAYVSEVR